MKITRGVDIASKVEFYEIVAEIAKDSDGVIFITSELTELLDLCHRVIIMYGKRVKATLRHEDATRENRSIIYLDWRSINRRKVNSMVNSTVELREKTDGARPTVQIGVVRGFIRTAGFLPMLVAALLVTGLAGEPLLFDDEHGERYAPDILSGDYYDGRNAGFYCWWIRLVNRIIGGFHKRSDHTDHGDQVHGRRRESYGFRNAWGSDRRRTGRAGLKIWESLFRVASFIVTSATMGIAAGAALGSPRRHADLGRSQIHDQHFWRREPFAHPYGSS